MSRVLLTGGTGFIGSALTRTLMSKGFHVTILTRSPETWRKHNSPQRTYVGDLNDIGHDAAPDIIINLAGEALDAKRWSAEQKTKLIESRVNMTSNLAKWCRQNSIQPDLWINGSAIGWYGPHDGSVSLSEDASYQEGFSHELCERWEATALEAEDLCKRMIRLRIGVVLEKDGGPLKAMLPAFRLGMGGRMGSGEQVWSWIHREDLIGIILHCIDTPNLSGALNGTAPEALPQKNFAKELAEQLHRPCIMPMPAIMAKLVLGEFAEEILLQGQRVVPQKALDSGYEFSYPSLEGALAAIFA